VENKPASALKHFILAFVIALVGYAIVFQVIESQRKDKGPWQVVFTTNSDGYATMVIEQTALAISNVQIVFRESQYVRSGAPAVYSFDQPTNTPFALPFGECKLMDLRFLPGTVGFQTYGHDIQLLPRVLMIDGHERRWNSDDTIMLRAQ